MNLTDLKFKKNGSFNNFSGNTVVANLFSDSKVLEMIDIIQNEYKTLSFIDKYTLTPKQSIHMTVIELLCDKNRDKNYWTNKLAIDTPIEEVSEYFGNKLKQFPLTDENIVMKSVGILPNTTNLTVEPNSQVSEDRLKQIRDDVSSKTGVRFPDHDNYRFHISFGYRRLPLNETEIKEVEKLNARLNQIILEKLPVVEIKRIDYTTFDDMTQFIPFE